MLLRTISLFLIIILLAACGEKEKKSEEKNTQQLTSTFDTTDLKTQEVTNPDESFLFRYGFTKGEKYNYRLTVISNSAQKIESDTNITRSFDQSITYLIELNAVGVEKDSTAELECTFKSFNLEANADGQQVKYQSSSTPDSADAVKYAEYVAFIDNPFTIRVSKTGQILDVIRAERISNKFLELRGTADSVKTEDKIMIKDDLVKNIIKPLLAQIIREYPDTKMAKDSTWKKELSPVQVMIYQIQYSNVYKVDKLESLNNDKIAVVSGTINSKVEGKDSYTDERGINYKFKKPVSTASGKVYFNLTKGLVQKSKTQTTMESTYSMEMKTPTGLQKAKQHETITNKNILELL
jgi:Family of unknown function (DUF6263)